MAKVDYRNIEKVPGICGGRAVVAGTGIRVSLIISMHREGHTVDQIIQNYPHLRHADVFDALAYAFDHSDEMDKDIAGDNEAKTQKSRPSGRPPRTKGGGLYREDDPIVQEWLKIMQDNRRKLDEEEGIER
jgi:uncharacterized protein (DUF433 family)